MKLSRALIAVLALVISSPAADLPATFQQAVDLSEAQRKLPAVKQYSSDILLPVWKERMGPIFQACSKTVEQPDHKSFSFVAALGPDGRALHVWVDRETNIYPCLLVMMKNEQFPAPPQAPYYWHISMTFTESPPWNAARNGEPPLVVERKYSCTFGLPAGWEFNVDQAYEHGSSLAYFPKRGSFTDSSSVIYVTVFADDYSESCITLLSDSITATLSSVKAGSPRLEVKTAEPILTKGGTKAAIRVVMGAKDRRDPKSTANEALAFLANDDAILLVVLTSRDAKNWEQDYSAFQQIVAGHRFFSRNARSLAVGCPK
jgi:hypothetical protein